MPDHEEQIDRYASQPAAQGPALSSNNGDMAELRHRLRYRFPVVQRIAPRHDVELPQDGDFFQVKFYDLSQRGASFLLAVPPSFKRLVVALAISPEDTSYVGAEVVHVTGVRVSRSGLVERFDNEASHTEQECSLENKARRMFLVGCRLTEHLGTRPTSRLWLI